MSAIVVKNNPIGLDFRVAVWEKMVEEDGNSRYAETYHCRINDVRINTVRIYDNAETAVVYEWTRPATDAAEQWTCPYCESVVTGKFCCNCGAARG